VEFKVYGGVSSGGFQIGNPNFRLKSYGHFRHVICTFNKGARTDAAIDYLDKLKEGAVFKAAGMSKSFI
jgi:hypothetical protein